MTPLSPILTSPFSPGQVTSSNNAAKLEQDAYPHRWHAIQLDARFTLDQNGPFPGSSRIQSWLCDQFGTGVIVEGGGFQDISPANYPWVFYQRGHYALWPDIVIKFRHEWQKIQFILYWGDIKISEPQS